MTRRTFVAEPGRLDAVVAAAIGSSRAEVQRAIAAGDVTVDDAVRPKSFRLSGGERIVAELRDDAPLQPFRQPQAPRRALAAIGPLTPDRPRQLEQRERVAQGLVEDEATRLMVKVRRDGIEQLPRGGLAQRSHMDLW